VFNIDFETCSECGGPVKVIACIEDPVVIEKILTHLEVEWLDSECGLGQISGWWQGAVPFVTRG